MRFQLVLSLFAASLFAQTNGVSVPVYTAYKETALTAAAEVVTIRVPATTNKSAYFVDAGLYCSVACEITLEAQGTYSTGTTITPTKGRSTWAATEILATHSTSIASTTVMAKYVLAAGEKLALDLHSIFLTEAADALTFRTNSITGTAIILVRWEQR